MRFVARHPAEFAAADKLLEKHHGVRFKVTGITVNLPDLEVIETEPDSGPVPEPTAEGSTLIRMVPGAVPSLTSAVSQPLLVVPTENAAPSVPETPISSTGIRRVLALKVMCTDRTDALRAPVVPVVVAVVVEVPDLTVKVTGTRNGTGRFEVAKAACVVGAIPGPTRMVPL